MGHVFHAVADIAAGSGDFVDQSQAALGAAATQGGDGASRCEGPHPFSSDARTAAGDTGPVARPRGVQFLGAWRGGLAKCASDISAINTGNRESMLRCAASPAASARKPSSSALLAGAAAQSGGQRLVLDMAGARKLAHAADVGVPHASQADAATAVRGLTPGPLADPRGSEDNRDSNSTWSPTTTSCSLSTEFLATMRTLRLTLAPLACSTITQWGSVVQPRFL